MNEVIKCSGRRSQEQWQALIEAQQHSGLSARAFCAQQAIGYASFCHWRRRFSTEHTDHSFPDEKPGRDFIDLTTLAENKLPGWHIVLKLGDGMELSLTKA